MSLEPALDLLVEEPQLHQQDQAGHTQEHVGPQLEGGGREKGGRGLSLHWVTMHNCEYETKYENLMIEMFPGHCEKSG